MSNSNTQNDFSKGSIVKNIMNLAIPMTLAQLINVLYNIVDRIYIGRIPDHATLSLASGFHCQSSRSSSHLPTCLAWAVLRSARSNAGAGISKKPRQSWEIPSP